jgi:L-alanine-DL-glutamate epimerase-like enolase superfamily enzyme
MSPGSTITEVSARRLDAAMNAPFEIAGGAKTAVANVLVEIRLADGTRGFGEGAPMAAFNGETQAACLAAARRAGALLVGRDIRAWRGALESVDAALGARLGAARATLGMAVLDAWARRCAMPLRLLFGGCETRLRSDVTVTIVAPSEASAQARRIAAMGVRSIKIKVGRDVEEDFERVRAVALAAPGLKLMLDANQGYGPAQSIRLARKLKRAAIAPVLFEQPAARGDWEGLSEVWRRTGIPVAADESVESREDALTLARLRSAQVVNVKLMKCGLLEAWDIALICRAAGVGLMIGGMVESTLAMTCAAHFAAGLGGFSFVDLDTPLWFKENPMIGLELGHGAVYDLSKVSSGIGVIPREQA